ncbi:MAG: phenylalanine--tRNA ligase subunit beta [Nanoarchaeota archaeon]|nr:phenylalanine--tRNA ligase subunit beta [Nanoarchaeota archaeon]MBU0977492.1 phenylalanine--tRNA ligase subunit beta [Nanoarchaeota archaeon]
MSNVKFDKKEFEKEVKLTDEIIEKIPLFGTPLEKITEDEIEIEIFPNRPDILSLQGYLRSFKAFLGKETGLKKYKTQKPDKEYKVKIDSSVKSVRPFTACAIVKNLQLSDEKIKELIDLQEKLHITIGRNRQKIAIGIYPLEKISLPIRYEARNPKEIKFIPLGETNVMDGNQILSKHPTGRDYAHLLQEKSIFPVFVDSKDNILSMPPIINSNDTGKVSVETKEVFIECSGFHLETIQKTLNIIVTTLAEMGGKICQMSLDYSDKKLITPDLSSEKIKISLENVNSLLGLNLKEAEVQKLLSRMGHDYKNKSVEIAPWRTDILHEVDLIEDIAIAHGYEKLIPEMPSVSTIGEESLKAKIKSEIAEILTGLGLTEISAYHLIKKQEAELNNLQDALELENSKTEYKYLRPNLLTPALRILSENKDNEYPQEIFEIGTVFTTEKRNKCETRVQENQNLAILLTPSNITKIKQILDYLTKSIGLQYKIEELNDPLSIEGRTASIIIGGKPIGRMGELHPETLRSWGIKMPISYLEISLEQLTPSWNQPEKD